MNLKMSNVTVQKRSDEERMEKGPKERCWEQLEVDEEDKNEATGQLLPFGCT